MKYLVALVISLLLCSCAGVHGKSGMFLLGEDGGKNSKCSYFAGKKLMMECKF